MNNNLPSDPIILLSVVNTRLRDKYQSLDDLCDDLDIDRRDLEKRLSMIGYIYNPRLNQFK
ncbi:MAG: DUF4250 domain-containing protein [Bacteroides sp.]|nr:DUF4250 domain-containing protein [Bacteroides sp.]MCM1413361.1 DUF4250 domain-containing protein [Bacteroides sp.]MCM1471953.1 DUF4250 domain-containing protein [Bacteroides sp.]